VAEERDSSMAQVGERRGGKLSGSSLRVAASLALALDSLSEVRAAGGAGGREARRYVDLIFP